MDEQQFNEKINEMTTQMAELKAASEAAVANLATETAARVAAEARVAALETTARQARFAQMVAGGEAGHRWYGEVATHTTMLETLATTFGEDSDQFKSYVAMNEASAKQLHESGLFKETGHAQKTEETNAFSEKMKTYREANPGKTEAEAMTAVLEANPEIYTEYQKNLTRNAQVGKATTL